MSHPANDIWYENQRQRHEEAHDWSGKGSDCPLCQLECEEAEGLIDIDNPDQCEECDGYPEHYNHCKKYE